MTDLAQVATAVAAAKSARPRSTAERGEDGKVIRKGKNLSGNAAWQRKFYWMPESAYTENAAAIAKMPRQVRLILKAMVENGITNVDDSALGLGCVDVAKACGMETPIKSDVLFAYYRKKMESVGLQFAYEGDIEEL